MRKSYSPKPATRYRAVKRRETDNHQPLRPGMAKKSFLATTLVILLGLGGVFATQNEELIAYLNPPVTSVRLGKEFTYVREGEVKVLLAAYLGKGFFNLDVRGVKQQLESHPWVANAEVTRVWPGYLSVNLKEQVPIARWGNSELLNQYGEIFRPPNMANIPVLPLLTGPEGSQIRMFEQYRELNKKLFPAGRRLERLSLTERGSWELGLDNGMQLIAGRVDVPERVQRFIEIYDRRIGNDIALIEWVDLRYANGFTVRRSESDVPGVVAR